MLKMQIFSPHKTCLRDATENPPAFRPNGAGNGRENTMSRCRAAEEKNARELQMSNERLVTSILACK